MGRRTIAGTTTSPQEPNVRIHQWEQRRGIVLRTAGNLQSKVTTLIIKEVLPRTQESKGGRSERASEGDDGVAGTRLSASTGSPIGRLLRQSARRLSRQEA